jgi:hypothetical protein
MREQMLIIFSGQKQEELMVCFQSQQRHKEEKAK